MGFQRNTISDEEHKRRSLELLAKGQPQSNVDIYELYFLYNDRIEPRKQVAFCGPCNKHVWNSLNDYYANK